MFPKPYINYYLTAYTKVTQLKFASRMFNMYMYASMCVYIYIRTYNRANVK